MHSVPALQEAGVHVIVETADHSSIGNQGMVPQLLGGGGISKTLIG